jgi:hypothetical protein
VFLLNALGSKCDHTSANGANLGAVSSIFKVGLNRCSLTHVDSICLKSVSIVSVGRIKETQYSSMAPNVLITSQGRL